MTDSAPVIELEGVTKTFAGVTALDSVDLELVGGEVHALVGENGAGKSTLVKTLAGVHVPDRGTLRVSGTETTLRSPGVARRLGIAVIYQQPALFFDLDIAENVFMGRHPTGGGRRVLWSKLYREVQSVIDGLGVRLSARAPVKGLSVADQQLVEIARALSLDARVLIMDEPTAALSSQEVEQLFGIVRRLRDEGVAILFVSHQLEEVFALADQISVLRDGHHVVTAPTAELSIEDVIRAMVGRELEALFPKEAAEIGETVLELDNLSRAGAFEGVSLELRRGEI
ncbi:MAG: ATP-binding cassette domain-containing protein, partial [Thermoleophilaceae bacterium]